MNGPITTEELYIKRDQIPKYRMQKWIANSDRSAFEGAPFTQLSGILSRYYLLRDSEDELVQNISIDHNTLFLVNNKQEMSMRSYLAGEINEETFLNQIREFTYGMKYVIKSLVKNEEKLVKLKSTMDSYQAKYIELVNTDDIIRRYGAAKELMDPFIYRIKNISSDMIYWDSNTETTQYSSETESDNEPSTIYEEYEEGLNLNE